MKGALHHGTDQGRHFTIGTLPLDFRNEPGAEAAAAGSSAGTVQERKGIVTTKGEYAMTDNEKCLLEMIRGNDEPGKALLIAVHIISQHLERHGSSAEPLPADPLEPS